MSMSSFVMNPLKLLGKVFFYTLLTSVIFIIFVLLTHFGQKNAISLVSTWINHHTEYHLTIDAFKGNLLRNFKIGKLNVKKQSIDLIDAREIDISWQLKEILNYRIHLKHFKMGSLFLTPAFKEYIINIKTNQEEESPKNFNLNEIFPPIIVDQLLVPVYFDDKKFLFQGDLNFLEKKANLEILDNKHENQWALSMFSSENKIYFGITADEYTPYLIDEIYAIDPEYYPLKLNLNTSIYQKNKITMVEIEKSKIKAYQKIFDIQGQLNLKNEQQFEANDFIVTYEKGNININSRYINEQIYLDARIKNLALPHFKKDDLNIAEGTLNAKVTASGSIIEPQVKALIFYETSASNDKVNALPIEIRLEAETKNNQLVAQTEILSKTMPVMSMAWISNWSNLKSFQEEKLKANLNINSEVDVLSKLFKLDGHEMSGIFKADVQMNNGFDLASIKGQIKLIDFNYKNREYAIDVSRCNLASSFLGLDNVQLTISTATINGGKLHGEGRYTPTHQNFNFSANNISTSILTKLPIDIRDGTISLKGNFDGTLKNPDLSLLMNVNHFYVTKSPSLNKAFSFESAFSSKNNKTKVAAKLFQSKQELSSLNLDIKSDLNQLINDKTNADISGMLNSKTDLGALSKLFVSSKQDIQGFLSTNLIIDGKIKEPMITGDILLDKGKVEDKKIGLLLANIILKAKAEGNRINIHTFTATDQINGRMQFGGYVQLTQPQSISLSGNMNNMQLLNSDTYKGTVNANLALKGDLFEPLLSGRISWSELNITLPDSFSSGIPEINYVIKDNDSSAPQKAEKKSGLKLEVQTDFPRRAFIRGKGLDAELGGELLITGNISDPIVVGKLSVIRGTYTFLDKVFDIKKGDVGIDGDDIELDLRAEAKAKDLLAIVSITGTPEKAKIEISSVPTLPEDEIISKLLFGGTSDSLSPLQAIQLANTLSSLSGMQSSGGQLDLLSKTRSFLGVDALSFIGGNLGAGKYLSDNVYIRGEQGAAMDDARIAVEIEVNKHVTIESSAGMGTSANDIKIFWKKDY